MKESAYLCTDSKSQHTCVQHEQINKNSGTNYAINLDPYTIECMRDCRDKLSQAINHQKRFSNNVLARVAMRHYHEHLCNTNNINKEVEEAMRAK